MSNTSSLSNKQALDLIKGVNLSPALQKSKDSILLAEDQYPEHLDIWTLSLERLKRQPICIGLSPFSSGTGKLNVVH
jgi:hypothetical protein